jgi:MtN3 and saliva related transmembrane protein
MPASLSTYCGFAGASLTTVSFLPQLLRVWRSRSARDISAVMYSMFIAGLLLWIIYGISISAWPIVIANTATALQAVAILALKAYFDRAAAPRDA